MSSEWTWSIVKKISSDTEEARVLLNDLLARIETNGWPEEDKFGIHLSVEEALMNAIKHGNQRDPEKFVHVEFYLSDNLLRVSVLDEGEGFNPNDVPDPTLDENLELPSGRGLMLMRTFMSFVEYNEKGNGVRMEKKRSVPDATPPEEMPPE
jgi:serine/threonine-protein kinase RsbW